MLSTRREVAPRRFIGVFLWLGLLVHALEASRTLVVLENSHIRDTHSTFFQSLKDHGHKLVFHDTNAKNDLEQYGEWQYDNLVLFAPSAQNLGSSLTTQAIVGFIDSGRNVLVAGSPDVADPTRELANECGVDFDAAGSYVIDHLHYVVSDDNVNHTLVASTNVNDYSGFFSTRVDKQAPILFRGIGHAVNEDSRLITKIVQAHSSAFSFAPNTAVTKYPQSAGTDAVLVTAMQGRNNARVLFSGSLDMFSDEFFFRSFSLATGESHEKSGNERLCTELAQWTFQDHGVLRAENVTHLHVESGEVNPSSYRIKEHTQFGIDIVEKKNGKWVPFVQSDLQLEFVMLDPYIRTFLKHNGKGHFAANFRLPDVYGVFKFRIRYHKPGYSNLDIEHQVPVRPFRHDEYERFIPCATPYYAAAFSSMAAFFVFGLVFLYAKTD